MAMATASAALLRQLAGQDAVLGPNVPGRDPLEVHCIFAINSFICPHPFPGSSPSVFAAACSSRCIPYSAATSLVAPATPQDALASFAGAPGGPPLHPWEAGLAPLASAGAPILTPLHLGPAPQVGVAAVICSRPASSSPHSPAKALHPPQQQAPHDLRAGAASPPRASCDST